MYQRARHQPKQASHPQSKLEYRGHYERQAVLVTPPQICLSPRAREDAETRPSQAHLVAAWEPRGFTSSLPPVQFKPEGTPLTGEGKALLQK